MADEDEDEIVLSVFSLYYRYLSVEETGGDMTPTGFGVYLAFARDELSRQLSSRGIPEDAFLVISVGELNAKEST